MPYGLSAALLIVAATLMSPVRADDGGTEAMRDALAGRSWMAARPAWPCGYRGRFEQRRRVGGIERELVSTGRFRQDCRRGLVWLIEKPSREALVYTAAGSPLSLRSRDRVRLLDGLVERRVAALLLALFAGDAKGLSKDFRVAGARGDGVALVPRDTRVAERLDSLVLAGGADEARVRITGQATGTISLVLSSFAVTDEATGQATDETAGADCGAWLAGDAGDRAATALADAACDALRYPARYAEQARIERDGVR